VLSDDDDDAASDDSLEELPVEDFPADEQETADTTAHQHYEEGKDQQGIPWERLQVCSRQQHVCLHTHLVMPLPKHCMTILWVLFASFGGSEGTQPTPKQSNSPYRRQQHQASQRTPHPHRPLNAAGLAC
jgi:hypothetical protein